MEFLVKKIMCHEAANPQIKDGWTVVPKSESFERFLQKIDVDE